MMPETNEGQRLQYAIQAAMRAVQARGGDTSSSEWGPGEDQLDQVHNRLKDAIRDRVAQRVHEKLAEAARERVREVVRDKLFSELRAGLLEAQSERGFDFSRIERKLGERLSEALAERMADAIRSKIADAVRERLGDVVCDAVSDTAWAEDADRIATKVREYLEPE